MKHTALPTLPWSFNGYDDHCQVGRKYLEVTCCDGFEIINQNGLIGYQTAEEGIEMGKFLVQACNCHEELVEALKALVTKPRPERTIADWQKAEQALANATK